ncbi:MAG: hypothetical protein KIT09_32125 [Bryobacteraceae bacterium]|nr:hypothetical protein [Bryobacteraceae bacterium]
MLTIASYDRQVEQLFDLVDRLGRAFAAAGIEYRLVGGMAVYFHVQERDPLAARLTRDIDVAVQRSDIGRVAEAVRPFGLEYRHAAGVDMLVDAGEPSVRSAVRLVFACERIRPDYLEPVPDFSSPARTAEGVLLAPVLDLLVMKLTSFRLKDQVHIKDMDGVGLITPEMEARLPAALRDRLRHVRSVE